MANGWQLSSSALPLTSHSLSLFVCLHFAALNISESLNLCYGAKHFRPDCVCECEQLQLQSWLIKSILIDHFATKSICNAMRMFSIIRTISLIAWQTSSSKKTTSKSSTYAKQKGEQGSKGERERRRRRMGKGSVHKALRLRAAALCWAYSQINLAALQAHWQQGQRDKEREREREHVGERGSVSIAHCSTSNESPSRFTPPTSIRCCNLPGARPHFCYFIIAVVCMRCLCVCVCGNCCCCCSRSCCQWLPLLISLPALYKSFVFCLTRPDPARVGQGRPDHTIPLPATTAESSRVELRHVECSNSSQPIWQPLGVASSGLKTEHRSVGRGGELWLGKPNKK